MIRDWYEADHPISIHALHEESDARLRMPSLMLLISIHALHEESDSPNRKRSWNPMHFNPRSP